MANMLDGDGLAALFNIEGETINEIEGNIISDDSISMSFKQSHTPAKPITSENVYEVLSTTANKCNDIIEIVQDTIASMPDNTEIYSGAASLLNTQTTILRELTKINMEMLRHRNKMELAQAKADAKIELAREKARLKQNEGAIETENNGQYIEYSQEDTLARIVAEEASSDIEG